MTKKDASAKLYLENAVVKDVTQSQYSWRVKATVERETRDGDVISRWFTLWFKERPDIEPGWVISASGYLKVKGWVDDEGKPRVSVEVIAPELLSAVAGEEEKSDPWAGSAKGWE